MTLHGWLTLIACAGQLALALLAILRGGRSPLALPLALLCFGLFSWNLAALAHDLSGRIEWRWLDVAASPLTTPLALHFVIAFVGRQRELRRRLATVYLGFGALSTTGLLAFVWPAAAEYAGSPAWALAHLVGAALAFFYGVALLQSHLRSTTDPQEAMRTRLVFAALAIAALLGSTELLADLGTGAPRCGNLGALAAAAMLAIVALRFRLLENDLSSEAAVYALALGALAVVAYLGVFYLLATSTAMLVLGTVTVTLALLASMRQLAAAVARRRQRLERLALLGRFSAQMAHDLKNPLAALKGAVQYLKEEQSRGRSLDEHGEFLDLLVDQVHRIHGVVDRYQRLGSVQPAVERIDLNEIVGGVVTSQAFAAGSEVVLNTHLDRAIPKLDADPDLVAGALENLLRNAFEATPSGGIITVRTAFDPGGARPSAVIHVQDSGSGMDARVAERAFDDFYTTKAQGSGLGLSFVRRVAEAHGGQALLRSRAGKGTEVELRLPLARAPGESAGHPHGAPGPAVSLGSNHDQLEPDRAPAELDT